MRQALGIAGLAVVGFVVGLTGTFVHASTARPAGIAVPWGVILALAGLAALLVMAHAVARSRVGTAIVAACWLAPVFLGTQTRPSGDLLIPADARGLALLFGGVVMIGITLGLPATRPARSQRPDSTQAGDVG